MSPCKRKRDKDKKGKNAKKDIRTYTRHEVAKHNKPDDCYVIIAGEVYDLSGHVQAHSGGPDCITNYCGKDATPIFEGKPHSEQAVKKLEEFLVGEIQEDGDKD